MWMNLRNAKLETISKKKKKKGNNNVLEKKRKLKTWYEKELMSGWFMGTLD